MPPTGIASNYGKNPLHISELTQWDRQHFLEEDQR